jgi:integrase
MESFVRLRRGSGLDYRGQAQLLVYFDRFLVEEKVSKPRITQTLTERYQKEIAHLCVRGQYNRFSVVRQFCQYLAGRDPLNHVPESLRLVPSGNARVPYIYPPEEVQSLLAAASRLSPAESLRPLTYQTLIGLLYTSGIRIGEAMDLNLEDFDPNERRLFIREGKFRKDRWVWLSESTCRALEAYLRRRVLHQPDAPDACLFTNLRKRRLKHPTVSGAFRQLLEACGIPHTNEAGPRIHDLRHTFAVHRLLQWYREGEDVNARLPSLATHMGHVDIQSTQVYLQATPELIEQVDQRFHTYFKNNVRPKGDQS